jgi:hypothetical protein
MSLLGDTPFLNQLASSTSLLTDNIAKTDTAQIKNLFGNYNPNVASDYVYGPMGGIAQNRFDANQFQLPYQPGEFTTFGGQFGSGGFNTPYTPGSYTPGQFNQYGNVPVTGNIPSNVSTTTMNDRGGNGPNQQDNQKYSYETFNGKSYRVNNFTGEVEEADLPFGTASLLGSLINQIPGVADYRFENLPLNTQEQINNLVANDPNSLRNAQGINDAVKKTFGVDLNSNLTNEYNQAQGLTTPAGLLNRPLNIDLNPLGSLSLPTTPTVAAIEANAARARDRGGFRDGPGGGQATAGEGTGGCFIKGTMIEMADGTEKEITSINVGEETKGGTVEAKLEFMPHNIYDYKGVKVSGSHWVMEDNQFTEVENSKHGVLTDIIEPVYNFITSKHRIFIKGVEFGGFYSQDPDYYEPYFKQEKIKINKELNEKTT